MNQASLKSMAAGGVAAAFGQVQYSGAFPQATASPSKEKAPEAQGSGRFLTPIYLKLHSTKPRFSGIAPLPWSRSVP